MMSTLDEDSLKSLIEALKIARLHGFSSISSPIESLLEAATDICLLLRSSFLEGQRAIKTNPRLKELDVSDALGNPKMVKIFKRRSTWWSPELSEIFKKLATFFVMVKNNDPSILDFMSNFERKVSHVPRQKAEASQRTEDARQSLKARRAYHRRQRKKIKT